MAFCAIPAIDITKGSCVRLKQGLMNESTLYSENPVQVARRWVNEKATRIHLVDLDGAFSGNQENTSLIEQILQEFGKKISFQVGGGIRDIETVERLINIGATYVVIGTAAVNDPVFLERVCSKFSKKIIVALDGRDGKIATHGWSETTKLDVVDFAKSLQKLNINNILDEEIDYQIDNILPQSELNIIDDRYSTYYPIADERVMQRLNKRKSKKIVT